MSIRIFGPKLLLKFVPVKDRIGRIYIPNGAGNVDTHRMGTVEVVGSGCKGSYDVGNTLIFQVNDIMKWAQIYRRMKTGDDLLWLLESEIVGRVHGKEVRPDTLEIMGDYALFKPSVKKVEGSSILIPDNAGVTPEFIKYILVQKGPQVEWPITKGQEIIVNHGRITPLLVQYTNRHGDQETEEYGYTKNEWISGCIEGEDGEEETGPEQDEHPAEANA